MYSPHNWLVINPTENFTMRAVSQGREILAVRHSFPGIFPRKISATGGGRVCHKLLVFRDIGATFSDLIGHTSIFYNVSVDNL